MQNENTTIIPWIQGTALFVNGKNECLLKSLRDTSVLQNIIEQTGQSFVKHIGAILI